MLLRRTMPPRLRSPSHNEVEESSMGDQAGGDNTPPPPPPPPPMPNPAQFWAAVMAAVQVWGERNVVGCLSTTFFKHHPLYLMETKGPWQLTTGSLALRILLR